jgi:hypothetical protein
MKDSSGENAEDGGERRRGRKRRKRSRWRSSYDDDFDHVVELKLVDDARRDFETVCNNDSQLRFYRNEILNSRQKMEKRKKRRKTTKNTNSSNRS